MDRELPVSYLEMPATSDEQQIASLVERIAAAINTRKPNLLYSVYAKEAAVRMSTDKQEVLTRSEYINKLSPLVQKMRRLRIADVVIRVSGQTASVFCTSRLLIIGAFRDISHQRYFKCSKADGEWRIVEAGYLDG